MRILITGAGGQLGRTLPLALGKHELTSLPRAELDIRNLERVRELIDNLQPDLVVNAAAWTDVDGAESEREACFQVNALGPRNLALATAAISASLLHVSTDYVFDGKSDRAYTEYDRTSPRSVYGESKLAGEEAVRTHQPQHWIVRTAWLYDAVGPNFPRTMLRLANREEVQVVDDQRGSPTWAPHLAEAIARLIDTRAWGTWHLAGSGSVTWCGLTRELYRRLGIETPVRAVTSAQFPRPAARPASSVLESLQSPPIVLPPWQDGLAEFCRTASADPGR